MGNKIKPIIFTEESNIPKDIPIIDAYSSAIDELFFIQNPSLKNGMLEAKEKLSNFKKHNKVSDVWIYYPWKNIIVHTVEENIYFQLRTARNRNIITTEEQAKYRNMTVGIIGLSVGSSILNALVATGGPKNIKIADFDNVEITNLNRMVANLTEIGQNKTLVAAKRVWELDPFSNIFLYERGVNDSTIEEFILGNPKIQVFVDAMDSLPLKVLARIICRKHKIPVLMATSNGDTDLLDVERYDKDDNLAIFNGRIGEVEPAHFDHMSYKEWLNLAVKIVGYEDLTPRMKDSLMQIGTVIPSVPQLATTVNMGGASIAFAIRHIANNNKLSSGRYYVSLDKEIGNI